MSVEFPDVVVMGGGLAGLTLALQLRQQSPGIEVLVLERNRHPVPEAAHKVGESSVEIAANYFDTVLGLREHLADRQLKKFGFRFFFSDGRRDLDGVVELGASRYLATPSYQIDRGIFENFLGEQARARGIRFLDGATIREFSLGDGSQPHSVRYTHGAVEHEARAAWLVDASGRAGLIKHSLGLAEGNAHDANAVWFRIGSRIDINEWSDDASWLGRCDPPDRWLSTNHLVGKGYWVWLIPLSSGSHSVGIVADARLHPLAGMNSFERALQWLHRHQPRLAEHLEPRRAQLQDFSALRRFSYGCRQVYSDTRWAITGEAGVFLDPFYSPGGDFIAISNTQVSDLITRDRAGERIGARVRIYEQFFRSIYDSMLSIYVDQYPMFGDPRILPIKVIWDYSYYWGVLCQLFFQRRLTDMQLLGRVRPELDRSMQLNTAVQKLLREWSGRSTSGNPSVMLDQAALPWFAELNRGLRDELDEAGFVARMQATTGKLAALAGEIARQAGEQCPGLDVSDLEGQLRLPGQLAGAPLLFGAAA
jgi:flavin-dependent dehydrogenase